MLLVQHYIHLHNTHFPLAAGDWSVMGLYACVAGALFIHLFLNKYNIVNTNTKYSWVCVCIRINN